MSTRAIINVYDKQDGFNIYVHGDGGIKRVISSVEIAFKYAWELPRFEAGDFTTALIKVLKKREGEIYLITSTEKISDVDYFYQIYEDEGNLKVKITDVINKKQFLQITGR